MKDKIINSFSNDLKELVDNIIIKDKHNEMVEVEVFNKNSLIDLVNYVNNYKFIIPSDDDNIGNKIQYTKKNLKIPTRVKM